METQLTVVCVKWGTRYSDVWVHRLRAGVAKHLSIPHDFVCFTDQPVEGVECRPLTSGLTGWWPKLELLKPGQFAGQVLYFDLDVVLTRCVDGIVEAARTDLARLWMRDDFSYSLRSPKKGLDALSIKMLGGVGCCNSSVMCWYGDAARAAWDTFTPAVVQELHGDQNHISRVLSPDRIGFLPDNLVGSYKYGAMRNEPLAPVMVFHGNPKMDQLSRNEPLRRMWEDAA